MSTAPFTKEEMYQELRGILFTQASQIALVRHPDIAKDFLGVDVQDWSNNPDSDDLMKIDLDRFEITRVLDMAYDFAFQTEAYWRFGADQEFEIAAFGAGVTPHSFEGAQSPYLYDDSKVHHVVDMAVARSHLREEWDIGIRGLALLAGMTEPAVRNSLSKENIQTTGKPAKIAAEVALKWLQDRRGYVPTRMDEALEKSRAEHVKFQLGYYAFPEALSKIIADTEGLEIEHLAAEADFDLELLKDVIAGEKACLDVPALQRLGDRLKVDVPHFVGVAIEHGLRSLPKNPTETGSEK